MKRRNFIQAAAALTVPAFVPISNVRGNTSSFTSLIAPESERILVIVHLFGGNDGLNTLIPLDDYSNYAAVRGQMRIEKNEALKLTDTLAMHPRIGKMKSMFEDGKLGIIQSVGYPNQNRSHFRSTDIWTSASRADEIKRSGWIGRYLETQYPNFPKGYPSNSAPHPPAISIGNVAHPTCEGTKINFSQTVVNPEQTTQLNDMPAEMSQDGLYGNQLDFVRTIISQTNSYNTVIEKAAAKGKNRVSYDYRNLRNHKKTNILGDQLRKVARMIDGGLETKVYTVYMSGFDTHANQTDPNTTGGVHAELLHQLSHAISTFQADLKAMGQADRVLGMTFSEFGRRIRPNASRGTDHGTAGPMFLFGDCVQAGVTGENVKVDRHVDQGAGVPMQFDFRDVYGSILVDWFDAPEFEVRRVVHDNFKYIPLAGKCNVNRQTTDNGDLPDDWKIGNPFPKNAGKEIYIDVTGPQRGNNRLRYSLFDQRGRLVLVNEIAVEGTEERLLFRRPSRLPAGTYTLRLATDAGNSATRDVVFP